MSDLTGTTEYVYNEYKSLTEIQNPDESKISYSYDSSKKLTGVLDYDGENIIYTHDLMGNIASVSNEETTLATYTYNTLNRLSTVTHPNQGTTRYYYDPMGNISYMDSKSDDGTVINQYTYYSCDVGLTSEIYGFENGNTIGKFYYYDYNKRLISEDDWANGKETVYAYDANNNMTSKTIKQYDEDTQEYIVTNVTNYTYNEANQLKTETETVTGDTQFVKTTSYSYDDNGNMVRKTVILDSVVIEDYEYTFDAFNRLKSIYTTHYISDNAAEIYEYKYTYNGNNELSTVSTYTHDGKLISVKKYYWDRGYIIKDVTTTAEGGNTKKTITRRNIEPVKATSLAEEQPVVETYSLPANGIICTETINGNNVEIAGQIPDAKTKNQVALVVSTDVNNVNENNIVYIDQKTSTTSGSFNFNFTLPQNPADVNYGYIIGTDADVDSYIGTISEGQTDDEEPTTPARTVTCTETVDGNNVKISGQISDANSKNQVALVVSTDVNNVNENNIVYIDQKTSTTNGTFEFNFTLPQSSSITSYGYIIGTDADTETYIGVINIQQGGNEDDGDDDDNDHGGDTDITGTTVTVKYYLGADGVFAQTDIDGTSYLLKNGHGDTVTIIRNGNVVDDAEYDAYGNVENPQNITAYTYANYYYDSHSGMYYLRNRFYDSSIARFISEDPVKDGLNWYAYCGGNPVKYVDPSGCLSTSDGVYSSIVQEQLILYTQEYYIAKNNGDINAMNAAAANAAKLRSESSEQNLLSRFFDPAAASMENNMLLAETTVQSLGLKEGTDEYGLLFLAYTLLFNDVDKRGQERYNQMMAMLLLSNLSNNASLTTRNKISNSVKTGQNYLVKPLGRGSTGRTSPLNLREQLAMEEVMANPSGKKLNLIIKDKRWPSSEDWGKYSQIVNGIEIHYNYSSVLNAFDDFKFK